MENTNCKTNILSHQCIFLKGCVSFSRTYTHVYNKEVQCQHGDSSYFCFGGIWRNF